MVLSMFLASAVCSNGNMSVDNLLIVYEKATPEDTREALDSYFKYNRMVTTMAAKYGYSASVGAALFAALSPNNDYFGNIRDVDKMLRAAAAGNTIDSFNVSTYGHNKHKAWAIVHGAEPLDLIEAKKTRNFYLSILDPTNPQPVCVDGHMYNCWRNERAGLVGLRTHPKLYDEVADGVRQLAREVGIIPSQMQSILWVTHRRRYNILNSAQMCLWDFAYLAAGLGFRAFSETP